MTTTRNIRRLREDRADLIRERIQTAGHGRRARIQAQIDAIDGALANLIATEERYEAAEDRNEMEPIYAAQDAAHEARYGSRDDDYGYDD